MNLDISRYLTYGCSKEFPEFVNIKESKISFSEAKKELLRITKEVIFDNIKSPDKTIFQCSGGFDSSILIRFFENISTFCTCKKDSADYGYSYQTSEYFKTRHSFLSEESLTKDVNLESTLLEMNKIHSRPRGYTNDLGLYLFVKRIKEETDIIAGGEGTELLYLGYDNMFLPVLYSAVNRGQYDLVRARSYRDQAKILPNFKITFDVRELIETSSKANMYYQTMFWWTTGFTFDDIYSLGLYVQPIADINLFDYTNFIFKWLGSEFYFDRRLEYSDYFNLEWVSPFLDNRFIDFSLSLPIEMRNCLGQIKYVMYESLGHLLPDFIINRPKEGLVLSPEFYEKRRKEINDLLNKYLDASRAKIYNYIDFKKILLLRKQFVHTYDFIILKKVWMLLNLELWLQINK
jgi:asparagine synthase (glutamine-hydrolysing)